MTINVFKIINYVCTIIKSTIAVLIIIFMLILFPLFVVILKLLKYR